MRQPMAMLFRPAHLGSTAIASALVLLAPLVRAEPVHDGAALFAHHCQACHSGPQGLAGASAPHAAAFLLRMRLRLGLGGMPSFSAQQLSDAELMELVNYVLANGNREGYSTKDIGAGAS